MQLCWLLHIGGRIQGVGYRPFIYRSAVALGLTGWVRNAAGQVEILVCGEEEGLDRFYQTILHQPPAVALPKLVRKTVVPASECLKSGRNFRILPSHENSESAPLLPFDLALCDDCMAEIHDPVARRRGYSFTNCTQCGPRYSIIRELPYDRARTTMAGFALCFQCEREFNDPLDRRFHAQALACPACGPHIVFQTGKGNSVGDPKAIEDACALLQAGGIVAVKGVGGYHLLCLAESGPVERLRMRKHRPAKPFAVMFPLTGQGQKRIALEVQMKPYVLKFLLGSRRPIVLCQRAASATLAHNIAPGLDTIGVFFPYSPLHVLLLEKLGQPVVATSANISGEPVLYEDDRARLQLNGIADGWITHNRPIERPADDAVFCYASKGIPSVIRTGRGYAPLETTLPKELAQPTLAVGGHQKVTIALGYGRRAILSPHIGDMGSARGREIFQNIALDFSRLYRINPARFVVDMHPDYATSHWARSQGKLVIPVAHHFAHASALALEYPRIEQWLMFTFDGAGYGCDRSIWGGEVLAGAPGRWIRVGRMRPFRLPGGDLATREIWRSAAGLCWEAGIDWQPSIVHGPLAHKAWQKDINAPLTSAAGRLFDAAAHLIMNMHQATYEGEAPMRLETLARQWKGSMNPWPVSLRITNGLLEADWAPWLPRMLDERRVKSERAYMWHLTMAETIVQMASALKSNYHFTAVGLTGGVFQNRLLVHLLKAPMKSCRLPLALAKSWPCNDGGLSIGQLMETACRDTLKNMD